MSKSTQVLKLSGMKQLKTGDLTAPLYMYARGPKTIDVYMDIPQAVADIRFRHYQLKSCVIGEFESVYEKAFNNFIIDMETVASDHLRLTFTPEKSNSNKYLKRIYIRPFELGSALDLSGFYSTQVGNQLHSFRLLSDFEAADTRHDYAFIVSCGSNVLLRKKLSCSPELVSLYCGGVINQAEFDRRNAPTRLLTHGNYLD